MNRVCPYCKAFDSEHDYQQLARSCYPAQIKKLRDALQEIVELDCYNHGPESRATEIARAALARGE